MKYLLIILILLTPISLPDSYYSPTLSAKYFESLGLPNAACPEDSQILFYECITKNNYFYRCNFIIYGDGSVFIDILTDDNGLAKMDFYYTKAMGAINICAYEMPMLGLFESETKILTCIDAPGDVVCSYYISLRVGEKYYSIAHSSIKEDEPKWINLVEYIRGKVCEYGNDENSICGEEYLEKLGLEYEKYGVNEKLNLGLIEGYINEGEKDGNSI